MALYSFTPNTVIESAKVNSNFTNVSTHGRNFINTGYLQRVYARRPRKLSLKEAESPKVDSEIEEITDW